VSAVLQGNISPASFCRMVKLHMKFFNTAGPVNKEIHYKVDPLSRWNLEEIINFIAQEKYFILHAPRQTGKTSCMLALQKKLNFEKNYYSVYANIETAQTARNDVKQGIFTVLGEISNRLFDCFTDEDTSFLSDLPSSKEMIESYSPNIALNEYLKLLCSKLPRPLVLFIDEIKKLYQEHTNHSGQLFDEKCFPFVYRLTGGQPWLVNALAYEVTYEIKENRDPAVIITPEHINIAKEHLILSRQTHLDQLADKLSEERVYRVIAPMLTGHLSHAHEDDTEYCVDLGLIKKTASGNVVSNDIYKEVIPREISKLSQDKFLSLFQPVWINPDGSLNTEKLFTLFQEFWRENSDIWAVDMAGYKEAAPHLVFQAFLQRVVIELKMLTERNSYKSVKKEALMQTAAYADLCNATEAHIIVFDRTGTKGVDGEGKSWKEKAFRDNGNEGGYEITIWGM